MNRTHEQFIKEMEAAHDCDKCHGKIFCIATDLLGNTRCAYCHEIVKYPHATDEELKEWMKEKIQRAQQL